MSWLTDQPARRSSGNFCHPDRNCMISLNLVGRPYAHRVAVVPESSLLIVDRFANVRRLE